MRTVLIAFILGAVAVSIALSAAGLILGIAAQTGHWGSFHIGLGPVGLLSFERSPSGTTTSFGEGLMLLSLAGGALNALGAALLRRRA